MVIETCVTLSLPQNFTLFRLLALALTVPVLLLFLLLEYVVEDLFDHPVLVLGIKQATDVSIFTLRHFSQQVIWVSKHNAIVYPLVSSHVCNHRVDLVKTLISAEVHTRFVHPFVHNDESRCFVTVSKTKDEVRIEPTVLAVGRRCGYVSSQISLAVHGNALQQPELF